MDFLNYKLKIIGLLILANPLQTMYAQELEEGLLSDGLDWLFEIRPVFDSLNGRFADSFIGNGFEVRVSDSSYSPIEDLEISDTLSFLTIESFAAQIRLELQFDNGVLSGEQYLYFDDILLQNASYSNGNLVNPYTVGSVSNETMYSCYLDSISNNVVCSFYNRRDSVNELVIYYSSGVESHSIGPCNNFSYKYSLDENGEVTDLKKYDDQGRIRCHLYGKIRSMVGGHTLPITFLTDIKHLIEGTYIEYDINGSVLVKVIK